MILSIYLAGAIGLATRALTILPRLERQAGHFLTFPGALVLVTALAGIWPIVLLSPTSMEEAMRVAIQKDKGNQ